MSRSVARPRNNGDERWLAIRPTIIFTLSASISLAAVNCWRAIVLYWATTEIVGSGLGQSAPGRAHLAHKEDAMRRLDRSVLLGVALIIGGVLFLVQNLGFLGRLENALWSLCFGAGGVAFLAALVHNRARWWAAIPGCALLGIGLLISLDDLTPTLARAWGGALFLGMLGLGFWVVYLVCRACWWAIIPGGTLFTLALIAGLSEMMAGQDLGWVFFLGLSATFGLVYLLPTPAGRMHWAIYPAATLLAMALLVMAAMGEAANLVWPAALILAGVYMVYRTLRLHHV
jgi:hypothetical protein